METQSGGQPVGVGSYALTTAGLAHVFGVSVRRAKSLIDKLPAENLDKVGRERAIPIWLARKHWPNVFRDWPAAPPVVELVTR